MYTVESGWPICEWHVHHRLKFHVQERCFKKKRLECWWTATHLCKALPGRVFWADFSPERMASTSTKCYLEYDRLRWTESGKSRIQSADEEWGLIDRKYLLIFADNRVVPNSCIVYWTCLTGSASVVVLRLRHEKNPQPLWRGWVTAFSPLISRYVAMVIH